MATAMNISAWSMTAASNDGADSTIGTVADGAAVNTVDNWSRGIMAAVRRYADDIGGAPAAVGGTADAITITTNRVISAAHEAAGFSIRFKAAGTNTGATTVAVDGLTAVAVERMDGTALSAGDIVSGGIYDIAYNATNGGYTLMSGISQTSAVTLAGTNAFTGTNTFSVAPRPSANDAAALGVSGTAWSDLFLATGAVINFAAGAELITHAANAITFSGFSSGINLSNNTNVTGALDVTGALTLGTVLAVLEGGTGASTGAAAFNTLADDVAAAGFTVIATDNLIVQDQTDGSWARFDISDVLNEVVMQAGLANLTENTAGDLGVGLPAGTRIVTRTAAGVWGYFRQT